MVKETLRPPWEAELVEETALYPGTPTLERWKSQQLINFRNWGVEVLVNYKSDDEGTLLAHGDQGGGYSFVVEEGELIFTHNGYGDTTEINCGKVPIGESIIHLKVDPPDFLTWDIEIFLNVLNISKYLHKNVHFYIKTQDPGYNGFMCNFGKQICF